MADLMTPRQAFVIGILFTVAVGYLFAIIYGIIKFRNDCEISGHKLQKFKFQSPIFYELCNKDSVYEYIKPYCYCKRCGKKVEYPFMLHKETPENLKLMAIGGYTNMKKEEQSNA